MFKKPFKQKSQISLKSSEKKKLVAELRTLFPTLTEEDVNLINGLKESLTKVKVKTIKDETVEVYTFDKVPLVFDLVDLGIKLPTVFMCWKFPHLIPQISTEKYVLQKLQNGADLFSPGVLIPGLLYDKSDFKENSSVYVNLSKNKAAMAVGIVLMSKEEILTNHASHQSGKVVKIYHIVDDFLYKLHPEPTIPEMGIPDWAEEKNDNSTEKSDEVPNSCDNEETSNSNQVAEGEIANEETPAGDKGPEKSAEELEREKQNETLEFCFLKSLKNVPKTAYPMLPATFYANHVLTSLPEGAELNIKKTKWKKFSVFLQEKSQLGLVILEPIQRGEFTIGKVNHDHELIRKFVDPYDDKPKIVPPSDKPSMQEVFSVSAATLPFFSKLGFKKNDEMTRANVRLQINDYIKKENLIVPENMEKVRLDPVLYEVVKGEEVISRADLLVKILEKMSIRYKISSTPNVVHKGKMPVVDFDVCTRRSNKVVTVISNLESYGVNVVNFSRELQQKAAASTTIVNPTNVPDKKGPQVQVQGNQVLVAANILKMKYNINEKFMRGLQKAPKTKNKKGG